MNVNDWLSTLQQQAAGTSALEWIAVIAAVAQVLLARANNIWLYPAGIISTALYIYLMVDIKLYAESLLNLYYLAMSIYGWIHWLRRGNESPLPITHTNRKEYLIATAIVLPGWLLMYLVLDGYTDSNVPAWDAWVSATAWAGMWLLARRKIENWLLLNLSNLFAIPLFIYKGLLLTACLTVFLFIVAIFGYIEWRKIYQTQKVPT
ncbi:MAG TPA: nicotinamide riboside transporter PnuC [Flavipsychrobacter sp.]|nr:nicotinamide riboside transporter PnuC [Flavipsychrobacter sp.]